MTLPTPAFATSAPCLLPARAHGLVSLSPRSVQHAPRRRAVTPARMSATPPEMPDSAKQAVANGENVGYWQGEWICVDCGYVYKRGRRVKFEDLPATWKCPQCNAPKRRFAKKAGDFIAETSGTSNTPIIIFSIVGVIVTIAFGIWASSNL